MSLAEFALAHDVSSLVSPVAQAARTGLTATPRTLPPWLFYDERGSQLFEQITILPEYYLTRTERALFLAHADDILNALEGPLTIAELGAGTATKTGILLAAAVRRQERVLYQPIDVSPFALDEARDTLEATLPGVTVHTQIANYITEPIRIERPQRDGVDTRILTLYIGSSIGNFSPREANGILTNLRAQLRPGDALVLGTDLAPSTKKPVDELVAAYDDSARVTAAFNFNILTRLNRELGADFDLDRFRHEARWNPAQSRIEMHLVARLAHTVQLPADANGPEILIRFAAGESIHTENSRKFTRPSIAAMLEPTGFRPTRTFTDPDDRFAVTLATADIARHTSRCTSVFCVLSSCLNPEPHARTYSPLFPPLLRSSTISRIRMPLSSALVMS